VNLEPPSGSKISVKTDGAPPVILVPHGSWPHRYSLEAVVRRRSPRSSGLPRFLASRLDPGRRHGDVLGLSVVSPLRTGVTEADAERRDIRLRHSFASDLLGLHIPKGSMKSMFPKRTRVELDRRNLQSLRLRETNDGNRLTVDVDALRLDIAQFGQRD
jgi:hypothetical protein